MTIIVQFLMISNLQLVESTDSEHRDMWRGLHVPESASSKGEVSNKDANTGFMAGW
jgi:hypothetical protein